MTTRIRLLIVAAVLLAMYAPVGCSEEGEHLGKRWLLLHINMLVDKKVEDGIGVLERAAAVGYNGVVLDDRNFYHLEDRDEHYSENARRLRERARALGLEVAVSCMPLGYSSGILFHNPNLAEGVPVVDMRYVVVSGQALPGHDPAVWLPGGDFEDVRNGRFYGWDWYDNPGESTIPDSRIFHRGNRSVRMERIGKVNQPHGHCRFCKKVSLKPFHYYHISAWVKTQDFATPEVVKMVVLAGEELRSIAYAPVNPERTQDWRQYHLVFNSLTYDYANIYVGVWGGTTGAIWWDDVNLEECGPVNILRRAGTPLLVKAEDGTPYQEGMDFEPVLDPRLDAFEQYHQPPPIKLTPNSRIREGQTVLVSFYHPAIIGSSQVMCCLSEPEVYKILEDQVRHVNDLLHPEAFLMNHDEIRCANWDLSCQQRGLTPGQLLADNVARCTQMIRNNAPNADIYVWSDMFDPFHNAGQEPYYLVNGSWRGSWEGLDARIIIMNWYAEPAPANNKWFAERGHRQMLAGYYDKGPGHFYDPEWLEKTREVPGIIGVMYTPWSKGYEDIEAWAEAVWGGKG
jgi:hypothetical protein